MADSTIDFLRIQISNPCDNGNAMAEFDDCSRHKQRFISDRDCCSNYKIVAWFNSTGTTNVGKNGNKQIIARIVGECKTTEIRGEKSMAFPQIRPIANRPTTGIKLECEGTNKYFSLSSGFAVNGPTVAGTCVKGEETITYYHKGKSTPIEDINYNNSAEVKIGLSNATNNLAPYVQYGAKSSIGSLSANCITNSSNSNPIKFLYIPCGNYADHIDSFIIEDGAFSGNTSLEGVWIDGNWGLEGSPFNGCNSIKIVYCPTSWENYFKDNFPSIKYINGIPYSNGVKLPTLSDCSS
jgi:hypothetical protein